MLFFWDLSLIVALAIGSGHAVGASLGTRQERGSQATSGAGTEFTSLLNTDDLTGWKSEHIHENTPSVAGGVMRLTSGPGWIATDKAFADFDLQFDARVRDPVAFTILVRLSSDSRTTNSSLAYGVRIKNSAHGRTDGSFVVYDKRTVEFPFGQHAGFEQVLKSNEWQPIEMNCIGLTCEFIVNGTNLAKLTNLQIPLGRIGFSVEAGAIELRNVRVRRRAPISAGFAQGAYLLDDDPDLKRPEVRREVKPQYTSEAMHQKIEGTVLLACVVKTDGSVGEIALLRSLDSRFGLDGEAVVAARQWRFAPATLRGQPVQTLVTIELSFNLHK
jgi:TonB family protein